MSGSIFVIERTRGGKTTYLLSNIRGMGAHETIYWGELDKAHLFREMTGSRSADSVRADLAYDDRSSKYVIVPVKIVRA